MSFISCFISCFLLALASLKGAEIRAICENTHSIRNKLLQRGAIYLSEYAFTDYIYIHHHQTNLNEEFVRIRQYQKTNWNQKQLVVVHKVRDLIDGNHKTPLKVESDTMEEAKRVIPTTFYEGFSFSRRGWEYRLENMHIFVEEIEGMPFSVEILGPEKSEILELFKFLQVQDLLQDSVPQYIQKNR